MANSYAAVAALIFAIVAILHIVRLAKRGPVQVGPYAIATSVSWLGLVVAGLLALWGFMQAGG